MNIIYKNPKDLKPYDKNAKAHDKKQINNVAKSIEKYGFKQPIVIDSGNIIVIGHCRALAAKQLKLDKVPCILADDLTDEQIKELRLVDNKTNESDWLTDMLELDLPDIDLSDFDFDFGLDTEDEKEIVEDEAPEVDEEAEPICKLGDIWQLGRHRLICGDSTDKSVVEALMGGKQADLVITDPPYNVDYNDILMAMSRMTNNFNRRVNKGKASTIENDKMTNEGFAKFLFEAYSRMNEATKAGGAAYIFHAGSEAVNFINEFKNAGYKHKATLIWVKNNFNLSLSDYHYKHEPILYGWKDGAAHYFTSDRTQTTVYDDKINVKKLSKSEMQAMLEDILSDKTPSTILYEDKPLRNEEHPTMKPIKLLARLILNSSRQGETVLDTFGGSGSTLIACEQTDRTCYMCELDPKYCDVIIKRYENFTGDVAVKV